MTRCVALFLSPSGALGPGPWFMAFAVQGALVFCLTRPLAAAAGLDKAAPSTLAIAFAAASLLILWSIAVTTLKRLTGMGLSRWHFAWLVALWLLASFFAGSGDPVGLILRTLNIAALAWLALPASLLPWPRRVP